MKGLILSLFFVCFISCNNKEKGPDISGINVDIKTERFDRDFFSIDSNNVLPGLNSLNQHYPTLTNLFLQNILGLDSASTLPGVKRFLHLSEPIFDSANDVFSSTASLEKEFQQAFRHVKYY